MSFLGISPGEGSRYALRKLLESRKDKHPVAAYLLEHGEWFSGRALPEEWADLQGPMSQCHTNTLRVCLANVSLRAFTGIYMVAPKTTTETLWLYHSWAVAPDGGVVEVTFPTRLPEGQEDMFLAEGQRQTSIPWLEPEHWAYVGVEYDPTFLEDFRSIFGLPVFDPPERSGLETLLAVPYSKLPFRPQRRVA